MAKTQPDPKPEMFDALHPDPAKAGTRVNKASYDAYRAVLLRVIPADEAGVAFGDLAELVEEHLPRPIAELTKTMWWVTTVKLDLEARGLIERVPGSRPQRVRRAP